MKLDDPRHGSVKKRETGLVWDRRAFQYLLNYKGENLLLKTVSLCRFIRLFIMVKKDFEAHNIFCEHLCFNIIYTITHAF